MQNGKAKQVFVVGMGMSIDDLTDSHLEMIRSAQILMGGRRHLALFDDLSMPKEVITGRLDKTMALIKARRSKHRIVVLASGDPLFFGIGARMVRELGPENVTVWPNVTSVAAAFARIKEPWSDGQVISLHGRDRRYDLLAALTSKPVVAVLTDPGQSPQWLARWLLDKGVARVKMAVFENLGSPEEAYGWYALEQAAGQSFAQPAMAILKPMAHRAGEEGLVLGMPENAYHHDGGMITKSEVRAVTLAKLRLGPGMTLWDLGAGSGSVGIEASVLLGHGRIVAVEKDAGRVENIRRNARCYGVYNHDALQAHLPEGLDALPRPDRIFIGGGGRDLGDILRSAVGFLGPGGVLVVNTVLVHNLAPTVDAMAAAGMAVEVIQLNVSKSKAMPWSRRMEAQNPIWIVAGRNNAEK